MIIPISFDQAALENCGFTGWLSLLAFATGDAPRSRGVYIVTYPPCSQVVFSDVSSGGWFKGRDPVLPIESLAANWIAGCETVYIGKASDLARRLRQFAQFGHGQAIGHRGGRSLWQLPEPMTLKVGWLETPDHHEGAVESALL